MGYFNALRHNLKTTFAVRSLSASNISTSNGTSIAGHGTRDTTRATRIFYTSRLYPGHYREAVISPCTVSLFYLIPFRVLYGGMDFILAWLDSSLDRSILISDMTTGEL